MIYTPLNTVEEEKIHAWLQKTHVCFIPGAQITPLAAMVADQILDAFRNYGHIVQSAPNNKTDIILTTAPFGKSLSWREAISLVGRMRYRYTHSPTIYTLVHITPDELGRSLHHFAAVLEKETSDPADFDFPDLAAEAHHVLFRQGKRGGPIMAFERLVQAQAKCLHVLLLVGEDRPEKIYHFDLVGGYPQSHARDNEVFYQDIVLRMVTTVSTHEITKHQKVDQDIPKSVWDALETPAAMHRAAVELGKRNFFTEMVRIDDIVQVPAVQNAVASQYSEGCFASWDAKLGALIATVTGSARPVDKGSISEDDLAVIVGVREDGEGALIRHVRGKRNDPPSSEAVEMIEMDRDLPRIELSEDWGIMGWVPVARSKLHGHRGISAYNPNLVEFVPLDLPFYYYPVTCATEAQARGIHNAFSRSVALFNPEDPRQVVFTVLPTHGVVLAEKWVPGKAPFQTIWEFFDSRDLVVDNRIPQGVMEYTPKGGMMILNPDRYD